jgi:hypothetical protein
LTLLIDLIHATVWAAYFGLPVYWFFREWPS